MKLCTLPLLAGRNIDSSFVVPTVASCIDLVVHLAHRPRRPATRRRDRRADRRDDRMRRSTPTASSPARRRPRATGGPPRPAREIRRRRPGSRAWCWAEPRDEPHPRRAARARGAARGLAAALAGARARRRASSRRSRHPRRARARRARRGTARGGRGSRAPCSPSSRCRRTGGVPDARAHRRRRGARRRARAARGARPGHAATCGEPGGMARCGRSPRGVGACRHVASRERRCAGGTRACVHAARVRRVRRATTTAAATSALPRRLKATLADPVADRMLETLRMAREVGGSDVTAVLRGLSGYLREDAALRAEVIARQSWIRNAARLGVAAPWLLLVVLASRHETLVAYDSAAGSTLIIVGVVGDDRGVSPHGRARSTARGAPMASLNAISPIGAVLGALLGLGLWLIVSTVPRLGRPRLVERVAPYVADLSAEARAMLAQRPSGPARCSGVVVAPLARRLRAIAHGVAGRQRRDREAASPVGLHGFGRAVPRRAARVGGRGIRGRRLRSRSPHRRSPRCPRSCASRCR